MVVERLRHSPPLPPVSSTPVGAARSRPGRQVGDPYQAQKLLACSNQRDTTYSPFTLTYYLRPRRWAMPGGLGNLREPTYWYRVGSVSVCGTALPAPGFLHVSNRAGQGTCVSVQAPKRHCLSSLTTKKASPIGETFLFVLALPIFPASHPASIVGADELNFCVRDGNRWTLIAINTNLCGRR